MRNLIECDICNAKIRQYDAYLCDKCNKVICRDCAEDLLQDYTCDCLK